MEARVVSVVLLTLCYFSLGAGYFSKAGFETENFVVRCQDRQLAQVVGQHAERYRKQLAIDWLGHELQPWRDRCPIVVEVRRHAEGRTSFSFQSSRSQKGQPLDWDMWIAGPPDRLLDAVLPHEITHTIFATHFGRPLPRWADEGACTTVEHISERQKNHKMLIEFLTTQRGIPFNQMFRMKEYPRDILPLYAQGYSVARYFIEQKGRRHFIEYLEESMHSEDWDRTTNKYYGFENLSDLQLSWISWIKDGCPQPADAGQQLASTASSNVEPLNLVPVVHPVGLTQPVPLRPSELLGNSATYVSSHHSREPASSSGSWYAQQMRMRGASPEGEQNRFKASDKRNLPGSMPRDRVITSGGRAGMLR